MSVFYNFTSVPFFTFAESYFMKIKIAAVFPFVALLLLLAIQSSAQTGPIEKIYPKTLVTQEDSFSVKFRNYPRKRTLPILPNDTVDMGTNGARGLTATIYYGRDSLVIPYKNLPFFEVYWIPIRSPKGTTNYRLHFNNITSSFSEEYIRKHKGTTSFEVPEVYELANIIWALSPAGKELGLDTSDAHYKRMIAWFKPYHSHPIFKKLIFPDSTYYDNYYSFRENSFMYSFGKDKNDVKLSNKGPYYYVMGDDWDTYNSLFKELRPMVADFAKKSGFRQFYKTNAAYYAAQEKREAELMPVKKMWTWLEDQFPGSKYQSYKVIFSPFITGSHSTQNYGTFSNGEYFQEAVMFVCGPARFELGNYTEKQKEGLASGIVFTEIDHNYINRITYKYKNPIDSIFSNREFWAKNVQGYQSPMSVFNEYMTHAAFCLYINDSYDKPTAELVIDKRISMMVDRRGFSKFKEFNNVLAEIRGKNPGRKVAELYPEVISWCRGAVAK